MAARSVLLGRWGLPLVLLLAWAPAAPAAEKVRVSVLMILASERDTKVDKRLECIAREVRKLHPKLVGFRVAKQGLSCKSLTVGTPDCFELLGGQAVTITVLRAGKKKEPVELKVAPPTLGEITYSTPCGKFLPLVTKYRHRNDLLLIAICVQPCPGK
jgi:hypothetical protein